MPQDTKQPVSRRHALKTMAGAAACASLPAYASDVYPRRTVTLIVPFPAGGTTDIVARLIAQKLSENLHQTFVVDNRGGANGANGANGLIGMEAVARAEPNGYTLLFNTAGAQTLTPVLYKTKLHPADNWEPISLVSTLPFVVVANEKFPVKDFAALVALARAGNPPVKASSGSSMLTLLTDELKRAIDAPTLINVPYKGTAPQVQAVLSGEVDISLDSFVTMPHIKAGKLRPLAVTSAKRVASLPDVPTLEELGCKGMVLGSWTGLLAPKGTPKAIVDRLSSAVQKIVRDPQIQERLRGYDHTPVGGSTADFGKTLVEDYARWQRIVKETGYKVS